MNLKTVLTHLAIDAFIGFLIVCFIWWFYHHRHDREPPVDKVSHSSNDKQDVIETIVNFLANLLARVIAAEMANLVNVIVFMFISTVLGKLVRRLFGLRVWRR